MKAQINADQKGFCDIFGRTFLQLILFCILIKRAEEMEATFQKKLAEKSAIIEELEEECESMRKKIHLHSRTTGVTQARS